ncbi:uncharacterized protein LOC122071984 [Macadamia integrifolia]|uniref:uncharacterized protein LOC122071984 n=1 Tax=Macadamia integrifolia TaxID=60698 RepID=UPI001C4FF31F|nr:uncharacterized protein LOC122071984 [Macadamia integrifolia]
MGEGGKRNFRDSFSKPVGSVSNAVENEPWLVVEVEDEVFDSGSAISSLEEEEEEGSTASTTTSITSSSSLDLTEDASSSPSQLSNGPLYELSDLMAQLPIKRGLSKHYQGKSQSFTSLASVSGLEDLAKRESPCRKRMKPCKSYGGGLETRKTCSPKAVISKKTSRGSAPSLVKRGNFMGSSRPPIPVQRNQCNRNLSFIFL